MVSDFGKTTFIKSLYFIPSAVFRILCVNKFTTNIEINFDFFMDYYYPESSTKADIDI